MKGARGAKTPGALPAKVIHGKQEGIHGAEGHRRPECGCRLRAAKRNRGVARGIKWEAREALPLAGERVARVLTMEDGLEDARGMPRGTRGTPRAVVGAGRREERGEAEVEPGA